MRKVAVVTDSAASLPPDSPPGLYIVPMQLLVDGEDFEDGIGISATEFYRRLRSRDSVCNTSSPSPSRFLDAFNKASQEASSILCITVSHTFSSTYDSAKTAIRSARTALPGVEIELVDSKSAAGGQGLVVTAALRIANTGGSLREVRDSAENVADRVSLFAFLDTLYYVWRGGRVPKLAYAGAAILDLKPVLYMKHGNVQNVARPRTRRRAKHRMLELMEKKIGNSPVHINVMHGDSVDDAEEIRVAVYNKFDCKELFVSEFSAVMGVHTGPGLVGVAFW